VFFPLFTLINTSKGSGIEHELTVKPPKTNFQRPPPTQQPSGGAQCVSRYRTSPQLSPQFQGTSPLPTHFPPPQTPHRRPPSKTLKTCPVSRSWNGVWRGGLGGKAVRGGGVDIGHQQAISLLSQPGRGIPNPICPTEYRAFLKLRVSVRGERGVLRCVGRTEVCCLLDHADSWQSKDNFVKCHIDVGWCQLRIFQVLSTKNQAN